MTAQISLYELYFQDYINDCNGYHEFVTNKTRSPPVKSHWVPRPWCIDLATARFIKASVWDFPVVTEKTRLISGIQTEMIYSVITELFSYNNFDT